MREKLRSLGEQVVVITGASAGLGLDAARAAAQAGAAVLMAAADEASLRKACDSIRASGGRAHPVVGDPATAEGTDRIARAAAARFGRFDSWIDASGDPRSLPHAAEAAVRHFRARNGVGALVGFGRTLGPEVRSELKRGRGVVSPTMIRLPPDWRPAAPSRAIVAAALYAAARPQGRLAMAAGGARLTTASQARKHKRIVIGAGLLAVAVAAAWLGRERLSAGARPRLARTLRPLILAAATLRPTEAWSGLARRPRQAMKLARSPR